jgi:hypothetical protein
MHTQHDTDACRGIRRTSYFFILTSDFLILTSYEPASAFIWSINWNN